MTTLPPIEEDLVSELRQRTLMAVEENGNENFHINDINRVKNDDYWLWRFIMHQRKDIGWAFDMIMECLKWRKEFGVNDIKESEFPQFLDDIGAMYVCNKDKEGHRLVVMHVRRYRKEPIIAKLIRRYFVHYMEKLEKEDPYNQVSIIFDMQGAGLSNVDMDFLFFMFSCFKTYYPSGVAYILAFDMPWLFSAMWKVVKSWLSSSAVNKIKFVNKKNVFEYIDPDQLLAEFGGNIPQIEKQKMAEKFGQQLMKMTSSQLAEVLLAPSPVQIKKSKPCESEDKTRSRPQLQIRPRFVEFLAPGTTATVTFSSNIVSAYKIRTTSPEKFRVRPCQGFIRRGSPLTVAFTLLPGYSVNDRDKFMILGMELDEEELLTMVDEELNQKWSSCPKNRLFEHQLHCRQQETCNKTLKNNNRICFDVQHSATEFNLEIRQIRITLYFIIFVQLVLTVFLLHYQLNTTATNYS